MAQKQKGKKSVFEVINEYEILLATAFYNAIDDLKKNASISAATDAIAGGDIAGAIRAFRLDQNALWPIFDGIRQAFNAGGRYAVESMPTIVDPDGLRLVVRFDGNNQRAEQWIKQSSGRMITNLIEGQSDLIRNVLADGMARGIAPIELARDISGRVDKATGKRVGGIIGLSNAQAQYVNNARQELISGDPEQLKKFLERARRDKRFDATILRAIKSGKNLDRAKIAKIIGRYEDGLLQLRGKTIARTEALASLSHGQQEAYKQLVDSGKVRRQDVRRVWDSAGDSRVRDSHRHLDGETVGLDERFSNGLMYPGDPFGAPEEIINCRCVLKYRIDFYSNLR